MPIGVSRGWRWSTAMHLATSAVVCAFELNVIMYANKLD